MLPGGGGAGQEQDGGEDQEDGAQGLHAESLAGYRPAMLGKRFEEAFAYAAEVHRAQRRKGTRRAEIRARFGAAVADIVDGCTDTAEDPKPPWRPRKERYVAHLAGAPRAVRLVSAADKLHNARAILADLRALGDALWSRFTGGKDGTLWYYRALVTAFCAHGDGGRLVDELERVVGELEALAAR